MELHKLLSEARTLCEDAKFALGLNNNDAAVKQAAKFKLTGKIEVIDSHIGTCKFLLSKMKGGFDSFDSGGKAATDARMDRLRTERQTYMDVIEAIDLL